MAIDVRPITLPKDAGTFIDVWWSIYKDDPHWVPPLRFERLHFLNPAKNPYYKLAMSSVSSPTGTASRPAPSRPRWTTATRR